MVDEPPHGRAAQGQLVRVSLMRRPFETHVRRWVDQKLKLQWRTSTIACVQGNHRREIAARAVAADRQAAGIDAEAGRVGCDPACGRDGVVHGGRELVLGRQPVMHRNDDAARCVGQRAADLVVALQVADHPAAAVEED